jgi:hypothetical protein
MIEEFSVQNDVLAYFNTYPDDDMVLQRFSSKLKYCWKNTAWLTFSSNGKHIVKEV